MNDSTEQSALLARSHADALAGTVEWVRLGHQGQPVLTSRIAPSVVPVSDPAPSVAWRQCERSSSRTIRAASRLTQGLTIAFVNPPAVDLSLRTPAGSLPFLPERETWQKSYCIGPARGL